MKLMLYDVDYNNQIEFEDGYVLSVECKNKNYFNQLIGGLKGVNDNRISVLEGLEKIDFSKDSLIIMDYFSLPQYEKTILTKFYKTLEKVYVNEPTVIDNMQVVYKSLQSIVVNTTENFNVDFEVDFPTGLSEYLKFVSLKPNNGFEYSSNGVINLISLVSYLKLYKILIFVNLKSFFKDEECNEIMKACRYENIPTLFIDNLITENRFEGEIKVTVDEDYYDVLYRE